MLKIGVSAGAQALRQVILHQIDSPSPDCRVEEPTRDGFLYWKLLLGEDKQLNRVDDNGYGLLGDCVLESVRTKKCFQAIVQASSGDHEALWLVHSSPFSPLAVCDVVSPIARLPNHLLFGEHLTRVDFLVGLDTVMEAVEAAKSCLGQIQVEPAIALETVNVPFQIFDAQVVNNNGVQDITIWQNNWEVNGLTLTE